MIQQKCNANNCNSSCCTNRKKTPRGDMQIIVSKTNVLFCLFSCAQAPVIVIESEEEKEEPVAESTFVPVEPEGMSASLRLSHCLSAQFCAVQSGNL